MPGGYIERAVALRGVVDDYHSINVMDLLRYWRRFPEEDFKSLIDDAVAFVEKNHVGDHWGESAAKQYALGFWAEALYHRYLLMPDDQQLAGLADAIIKLEQFGVGLSPSLLGANAEAVPLKFQIGCLSLADVHLRIVNLSRKGWLEFLVVNPTKDIRQLMWDRSSSSVSINWQNMEAKQIDSRDDDTVPPLGWVVGRSEWTHKRSAFQRENEHTDQGAFSW